MALLLCAVSAFAYEIAGHDQSDSDDLVIGHSGRLDSNGGHNCSEKSKRKGLCTGYHYHR